MKKFITKKLLPLLLLLFIIGCSSNKEEHQDSKHKNTISAIDDNASIENFLGVYHFGESEMESSIVITGSKGYYCAQIRSGAFNEEGTDFIWYYENLKNVSIKGNQFFSEKTNGNFLIGDNGKQTLFVEKSWSEMAEEDGSEKGYYTGNVNNYYSGDYTFASQKQITKEDLDVFSKSELEIMRNEIFARYGYIFKTGGKMDNYFKTKKWYRPQNKKIDQFLNDFEKINIPLINKAQETAVDKDVSISIKEFPKKWVGLSAKADGTFFIKKPCLTYNHTMIWEPFDKDGWYIMMSKPFDYRDFELHSFELKGNPVTQLYLGYIKLANQDAEGGDPDVLPIVWNRLEKWMKCDNYYGETKYFVSEENTTVYETITESCDEDEHY